MEIKISYLVLQALKPTYMLISYTFIQRCVCLWFPLNKTLFTTLDLLYRIVYNQISKCHETRWQRLKRKWELSAWHHLKKGHLVHSPKNKEMTFSISISLFEKFLYFSIVVKYFCQSIFMQYVVYLAGQNLHHIPFF